MEINTKLSFGLSDSLYRLLPSPLRDLVDVIASFLDLCNLALQRLRRPKGLYDVLSYKATMDVLDARGRSAIYEKRQRVRFLQDCPSGFPDYGWGDGRAFASEMKRSSGTGPCTS